MSSILISNLIAKEINRWEACGDGPESTLLRLAILREIIQSLHSEKSRCLASGLKDEAHAIREWEVKVEELKDSATLRGDLLDLVQNPKTTPKKKRILPEGLFQHFDRNKLTRYDRQWEATLVAEGVARSWKVWTLESWVEITTIEQWEKSLANILWPQGLILFAESAEENIYETQQNQAEPSFWRGRWVTLLHPQFDQSENLALQSVHPSSSSIQLPHPPRWKRIFP